VSSGFCYEISKRNKEKKRRDLTCEHCWTTIRAAAGRVQEMLTSNLATLFSPQHISLSVGFTIRVKQNSLWCWSSCTNFFLYLRSLWNRNARIILVLDFFYFKSFIWLSCFCPPVLAEYFQNRILKVCPCSQNTTHYQALAHIIKKILLLFWLHFLTRNAIIIFAALFTGFLSTVSVNHSCFVSLLL
jgi:hypothetical protein